MTKHKEQHSSTAPVTQQKSPTDVLGIISLGTTILGVPIAGFIIGLIGASKAKREGRSPVISRVGWVFGLVCTVIVTILIIGLFALAIISVGKDKKFLDAVMRGDYATACRMWGKDDSAKRENCEEELQAFNKDYTSYSVVSNSTSNGQSLLKVKLKTTQGTYKYGYVTTFIGRVDRFEYGYEKEKDLPEHVESL